MIIRQLSILLLAGLVLGLGPMAHAELNIGDKFADSLRSGGKGPDMVVIPDGMFVLGGGQAGQQDLGLIKLQYLLAFSATEITNAQYRQFLAATQSGSLKKFADVDDAKPAAGISWDEAEAYVTWLSRESGHYYRLPSASEWEYAARAGSSTHYSWGDNAESGKANCLTCGTRFDGELAPVATFPANAWGLYDMHGNVWEWTKDCIDPNSAPPPNGMPKLFGNCDSRELRGGSAQSDAWSIRAGIRAYALRGEHIGDVGFRVVREVTD